MIEWQLYAETRHEAACGDRDLALRGWHGEGTIKVKKVGDQGDPENIPCQVSKGGCAIFGAGQVSGQALLEPGSWRLSAPSSAGRRQRPSELLCTVFASFPENLLRIVFPLRAKPWSMPQEDRKGVQIGGARSEVCGAGDVGRGVGRKRHRRCDHRQRWCPGCRADGWSFASSGA